jgi:hypothetical protein
MALAFGLAVPAQADVLATIGAYNGSPDFDFNLGDYPLAPVTIGVFSFTIPAGFSAVGGTISGFFGNNDVSPTTAPSDYYVDNGTIEVASCDDSLSFSADCDTGSSPTAWSYTFTASDLATLASELASGNIDFTVVQNFAVSVQTGPTTLDLQIATPEPATIFLLGGSLLAIALFRRFRKPGTAKVRERKSTMKIEFLTLGVCAALCASAPAKAQVTWTATSSPIVTTLAGGPWLLPQGGPYVQNSSGTTTSGGPYDGSVPYCSPGGALGGAPIVNPPTTVNSMQPFYFPFVSGRGLTLQGYFDYRPRNVNEAVVAATSTNGGQSWTFQQQVLNLNTLCPQSDTNSANGNDDGEGHANVLSFGGGSILTLLDRRNGWTDSAGLIVKDLTPRAGAPLTGLSSNGDFGPPTAIASPSSAGIITQWNFALTGNSSTKPVTSPTPNIGAGTATPLGMTNSYTSSVACSGAACDFTGSKDSEDVTSTTGGTNPSYSAEAWRIRGNDNNDGGKSGDGWNTQAPQYTQGAQFNVNTTGYYNIVFEYDWYTTADGARDLQAQYTTNANAGTPTWTNIGPVQVAPAGGGFFPQIIINFGTLGITAANNNPNFAVRLVSVYDPTFVGPGTPCTTPLANPAPCTYTQATLASNGAPVQLNNTSGNWRFDEINVIGTPTTTNTLTFPTRTVGLTNPDGIVASVPGAYPFKVLYVDKTLNGDYAYPTSEQCGATPSGKAANHDIAVVRLATSPDGIHWTDGGAVNGLNVTTTTSYSGIRYVSPNGTLLKLSTGEYGLFFGAGNCLDGDSDSFHAIAYAESPDLVNWTVINGINNPIASVATVTATDPVTQQQVTIPAHPPVAGPTQAWFGGRVYGPQATPGSATNSTTVNLTFAGYDAAYSADISDYRTIGHVTLSTGGSVIIP